MVSSELVPKWKQHADNSSEGSKPTDTEKAAGGNVPDLNSVEALDETPTTEYPHGMRLVLIMISLMLSLFLVSLDNVSGQPFLSGVEKSSRNWHYYPG